MTKSSDSSLSTIDLTFSDGEELVEQVQITAQTEPNTSRVGFKLLKPYSVPNISSLE